MSKITVLPACLLLLLVSCTPVRDRRTLNDMEALMPERPDSALAVLRGLQPRDLSGLHVRPLHALLLSEALDKNYIDLTDDSLALAANKYYGEHGSKLHRLKSWYYLGRIRFNAGNYAEAVICYNKALENADALMDYHYMGLINREISNSFSKVWDSYHAVDYMQKSIDAFEQANEQRYSAYSRLALARMLRNQKEYENSIQVLNWIFENCTEDYLIASAYELKALIFMSEDVVDLEQVKECIKEAHIGSVLPNSSSRYANLALVHQFAGNIDSSDYYLNKASCSIASIDDSIYVVYNRYRVLCERQESLLANEQIERYLSLQDPTLYELLSQSVSFYQGSYYQKESRINALKAKNRMLLYGSIILTLFLLSIALVLKNRTQRAQIKEEMARTSEVEQELLSLRNDNQEIGRAVATLFENRLNILHTLSDKYDMIDEAYLQTGNGEVHKHLRDEIVESFRNMMRSLRKDKDICISMEEILDSWKDGIMRRFRSVFGADSSSGIRMTKEDFELAPYYFSGMKQKTISYLTNHTEHSIKERKRRIKQKIEALDSSFSKEKRLFLDNL